MGSQDYVYVTRNTTLSVLCVYDWEHGLSVLYVCDTEPKALNTVLGKRCSYEFCSWVEKGTDVEVFSVISLHAIVVYGQLPVESCSGVDVQWPVGAVHDVGDAHVTEGGLVPSSCPEIQNLCCIFFSSSA